MTYPMQHKIDMRFRYTTAAATDIRHTFAKERMRIAEEARLKAKNSIITPMGKVRFHG